MNIIQSFTEQREKDLKQFIHIFKLIQSLTYKISREKGFHSDDINNNVAVKIALIHSELSEALECDRVGTQPDKHCPEHNNIAVELADVVIRIMDLAEMLKINLVEAIVAKIEYNASRPIMHGGKKY